MRLSDEYIDKIDEKRWGKDFDVNNIKNHTAKAVIGYILYKMTWYKRREYDDYIL